MDPKEESTNMDEDDYDSKRVVATAEDVGVDVTGSAPSSAVNADDEDAGLTEEDKRRIEEEERELQESAAREMAAEANAAKDATNADREYLGHKGSVFSVAIHPTRPDMVVSGGSGDIGQVWNAGTGETVFTLAGHTDSVVDVGFNHDGSFAATAGLDGCVRVWSMVDGSGHCVLEGPSEGVEWMAWHPRGNAILAGSTDATAWLWTVGASEGKLLHVLHGHSAAVTAGCFWNEGRSVCTVSEDGSLKVWSPKTGECTRTIAGHGFHDAGLVCVDVHRTNPVAATGAQDTTVKVAHLESGKILASLNHPEFVETTAFCTFDMPFLATGCGDGGVRLWDANTGQLRTNFRHEDGFAVVRCVWDKTSPILYSASTDGTVRVWDYRAGTEPRVVLKGHRDAVLNFDVAPGCAYIISGSDDERALVFSQALRG